MAYRILTNDIIMLNHKAFVDNTLESHRFHNSEIQSAVMKPELFHIVVPYDGKPTRDEAGDKRKSRKRKRVEDNLDEITQKVKDKHLEYLGLLGLTEGVTEGSWFWTKVTEHGMPVCSFNETTKKQPYERLFIAVSSDSSIKNIPRERYIFSVPCAIHSNKPPLLDLFADLLPERPKCLELFARNVYPNFTSIGTEVLKLQNSRLFQLSLKHEVQ
ncbi:uncharacterized protein LOC134211962 isoform X2 [Armigeres subalbatus]|uniref:uncharacterized protein LOC134211962 isoform X2 n=1 Tax=Armigeres subalbatus TaxID=124917 RepID=UPI002ED242DA